MDSKSKIEAVKFLSLEQLVTECEAGSFYLKPVPMFAAKIVTSLYFICPCGCGMLRMLRVGRLHKPDETPSWEWDGHKFRPTLTPSVNCYNHWHGYLTRGEWIPL